MCVITLAIMLPRTFDILEVILQVKDRLHDYAFHLFQYSHNEMYVVFAVDNLDAYIL
jgi:hypothetical protein